MSLNLAELVSPDVAERLVLVLLHSLWQTSVIAAALWLALRWLGAARPELRYRLSVAALTLVAVMTVFTWAALAPVARDDSASVQSINAATESALPTADALAASDEAQRVGVAAPPARRTGAIEPKTTLQDQMLLAGRLKIMRRWSAPIAIAWSGGVLFMLLRVILALRASRRLVRSASPLDSPAVQALIDELCQRLGLLRRVQVKVCDAVSVPAVFGMVWPVLLAPPALITGLPIEQLRVILTHELAHIRRYDYLVNIGQLLVEAGLFFNPAVWWISRRIRVEREACCDALAVLLTGEPLTVARTLVDVASSLSPKSQHEGASAFGTLRPRVAIGQAYDGGGSRGVLWERVLRIATPGEIPRVRLPWYSLLGLLIGGFTLLVGLERSGEFVVDAATQWLSPQERVEKLEEIDKDYRQQPAEKAQAPLAKIRIAGSVRTADGSPLPPKTVARANVMRTGYFGVDSLEFDAAGKFDKEFTADRVYLHAQAQGYATRYAGPFDAVDGDVENIELVLDREFTTRIRFVTDSGEGVPGVALEAIQYILRAKTNGWSGYAHPRQADRLRSNELGIIELDRCSDWPSLIDVRGGGYQFERQECTLKPDATLEWKLLRARPTTGIVIDEASGRPVAGAPIYLVNRSGYADITYDPREPGNTSPLLATSDAEGRFRLDSLRDDCRYAVYVRAKDHGVKVVEDVRAGEEGIQIPLGPALRIRGQILGNLNQLREDRTTKTRYFNYRNPFNLRDGGYSSLFQSDVLIEDGVGRFEIDELFPGMVTLELPGRAIDLDLRESIDDMQIDLDQPAEETAAQVRPSRQIVLRFAVPEQGPAPSGQLRVGYQFKGLQRDDAQQGFCDSLIDVDSLEVRWEAPTDSRLFYDGGKLIGYWIANKSDIDVPAGDAPLEIVIPATPAGAAFGRVFDFNGRPATNCTVHLLTVEKAPVQSSLPFESMDVKNDDGQFALDHLPLGGRYRLLAVANDSEARALSEIFTIDEQHPLEELELRFVEGMTLTAQVLGPDGAPSQDAEATFDYRAPHGYSFSRPRKMCDADGRFQFTRIDPALEGEYLLSVHPTAKLCGATLAIENLAAPLSVKLERGESLSGLLIDAATSLPIANARLLVLPATFSQARYHGSVVTQTDDAGRFEFHNLEAIEYRVMFRNAQKIQISGGPSGTNADGTATLRAGEPGSATISVTRFPPDS